MNYFCCDGVTDDIQIQAAIDYVDELEGGNIFLKEGTFKIASPIIITRNILIYGAGIGATTLKLVSRANCNMFEYTDSVNKYFFSLKEMTLSGNKRNNSSGTGLYAVSSIKGLNDVLLEHVFIKSFKDYGIRTSNGWGWILKDVIIEFCDSFGLYTTGGHMKIISCKMNDNLIGAYLQGSLIMVTNSEFGHNNRQGINLTRHDIIINGCQIYGNNKGNVSAPGIRVGGDRCIIDNNVFDGENNEPYAIEITRGADNTIVGKNTYRRHLVAPLLERGTNTKQTCLIPSS